MARQAHWLALSGLSVLALFCSKAVAQESATVHCGEFVNAGETITLAISVDRAPNYEDSALHIYIKGSNGELTYHNGIMLAPGKTAYTLPIKIPAGARGGTWSVDRLDFLSGSGEPIPLPFTKCAFQVLPRTNPVFPTIVDVGIKPSQAQLLRTAALHLRAQIQDLRGQITEHKSDNTLTQLLRRNIEDAIKALDETERAFRGLNDSSKQQESSQVFFADLRTNYRETHKELKAQARRLHNNPDLILVAAPQGRTEASLYPLAAQAVLRIFEQNELAYKTVVDTGTLTFDLDVSSVPAGAAISYRRRGDDFKSAGSPTNCTIKALPFAIWIVRLEKDGFRAVERDHDPFRESNHVLNIELQKVR